MQTSEKLQTTVLATCEPQQLTSVLSELQTLQGVTFFTPSTGRFDLVIWLNTIEQTKAYALVNHVPFFLINSLSHTTTATQISSGLCLSPVSLQRAKIRQRVTGDSLVWYSVSVVAEPIN